jgi:hypothetical protein
VSRSSPPLLLLGSVGFALLAATAPGCAEADGKLEGGGLTPAGEVAVIPVTFTGDCDPRGTSWTNLYCSLFGPTGQPGSCTFQAGNCHGDNGLGASASTGIQCFDRKGCRESFIRMRLTEEKDQINPAGASIFAIIRTEGRGFMPKAPADYKFKPSDIARIQAWIADGVPDN